MDNHEQELLVQRIRARYTEKAHTEIDLLKQLDKKVRKPANLFTCLFGTVAALVMGAGMSLIMTDIGQSVGIAAPLIPSLAVGIVGMLMAIANYPIYRRLLNDRRRKYAGQILALSDKIMEG